MKCSSAAFWQTHFFQLLIFFTVYCPAGWFSTKGVCLKAFEAPTSLNYSKASDNCQQLGGQLAQPTNDLESEALSQQLKNLTNITSTKFWIGNILGLFFNQDSVCTCSRWWATRVFSKCSTGVLAQFDNYQQLKHFWSPAKTSSLWNTLQGTIKEP